MVTLLQFKREFRDRVAEVGVEFWSPLDEVSYINTAQKFVASVTRGVSSEVTGTVSTTIPSIDLPDKLINAHQNSGYSVTDSEAMGTVPMSDANMVAPNWRSMSGVRPKWFILDVDARKAYVSPIPRRPHDVSLRVSVLPDAVSGDSDPLFNGQDVMDKYLNATINMAAMYAFMKERYDGDAEKAYGFAIRELQELGINPNDIPPFRQVATDASDS